MHSLRHCWLGVLIAAGTCGLHAQPRATLLHKPAPEFVRTDLQQQRIDLQAYRGRVVLLTFWATWCAPCQVEMPQFIAWQKKFGPQGLQIVAVSMDDDAEPVARLVRRRRVNYPIVMGDLKLAELYGGILGLPVTYLIDRHGIVAARFQGETSLETMRAQMEILLGSAAQR
jgi:cytochrome c biogenesis protein CcmG, thiol:disulfide interchange protein DsbE